MTLKTAKIAQQLPAKINFQMSTRRTMIALLPAILVCAIAASSAGDDVREPRDPREYFFIQKFGDLPEEMQIAKGDGKLGMLLFFEAAECPYCHQMLKNVFSQQTVQDWYGERFVSIAVDIHGDVEVDDFDGTTLPAKVFSDQHGIFMTPVLSFIGLDGVEIYRHLGMLETAQELLLLGHFVEGGHYKNSGYVAFAKARGLANTSDTLIKPAGETT